VAKQAPKRNIAACVPQRLIESETGEDGNVKLLVPRFRHSWLQWLQRRLKSPYIKVTLDEIGSCAWRHMDGSTSVAHIGEKMKEELGEKIEPVGERLGLFLGMLKRNKFVTWDHVDIESKGTPVDPS
jgi:hypothetical protein